jgi:NAD(P)-dependent dehydrogenase (short-subunit alcohol dehydrogenase family)
LINEPGYAETAAARRAIARSTVPDDLVEAVRFLCSDSSALSTGQTLIVDGGTVFI